MATSLPRAARTLLHDASLKQALRSFRSLIPQCQSLKASKSALNASRAFSSSHRYTTTPAPSYACRADNSSSPSSSTLSPTSTSTPISRSARTTLSPSPKSPPKPSIDDQSPIRDMTSGMDDEPLILDEGNRQVDWTRSFHGLSAQPFSKEAAETLMAPIPFDDVEVKPDGIIYLPEIKYRRILNRAFGPGGWGLAPRGETIVTGKSITREYALVAHGRLVSVARGEQDYFSPEGIPTATEGCKSNALMRCCKDLGVASELWDPRYIRTFMKEKAKQIWVEHVPTKKKKQIWLRKDDEVRYPFKETKFGA